MDYHKTGRHESPSAALFPGRHLELYFRMSVHTTSLFPSSLRFPSLFPLTFLFLLSRPRQIALCSPFTSAFLSIEHFSFSVSSSFIVPSPLPSSLPYSPPADHDGLGAGVLAGCVSGRQSFLRAQYKKLHWALRQEWFGRQGE